MDKKNEGIYNMNFPNKKDNLRNEIPFQNMLNYQNNIFPFGPVPNIVFVDTNFLNKKRAQEDLQPTADIHPSRDNSKSKYFILFNIIYFL